MLTCSSLFLLDVRHIRDRMGDTVLMAALRAGRHSAASLLLQASAVPTAAAHTFRYAWVIAAALRVGILERVNSLRVSGLPIQSL